MADLREACARRFTPEEMELLDQAIAFAKDAHKDQKRESGEPYYTHPEAVAQMLFDMGMDSHTVIAGLLHDVVEDCAAITLDTVRTNFGDDIAGMVDGVTKLTKTGKSDILSKEEAQAENLRKLFLVSIVAEYHGCVIQEYFVILLVGNAGDGLLERKCRQ